MTLRQFFGGIFPLASLLFVSLNLGAQCDNSTQQGGIFNPTNQFQDRSLPAGRFIRVAVTQGNTYEFSGCNSDDAEIPYNSQFTLRETDGTFLAYNDDFCGNKSFISWTATYTGNVDIHVNKPNCGSGGGWGEIMIREIEAEIIDCTPISMVVYQDDCEIDQNGTTPTIGFDFDINGPCNVTEFCYRTVGNTWTCVDLNAQNITADASNDLFLTGTTPNADYEFYFTTSDGSVSTTYTWTNGTCECVDVTFQIDTDCWGDETSWDLLDANGNLIDFINSGTLANESTNTWTYCLPVGCYEWVVEDTFGDGMFGSQYQECTTDGNYSVTNENGTVLVQMASPDFGSSVTESFCVTADIPGCTNSNATNYDATATTDDGSCTYVWYSVASGNSSGAIWNPDPASGTGLSAVFGAASSFVVRNGQTVTVDAGFVCDDLTVEDANGAGNLQFGADHTIEVRGDMTVSGGVVEDTEGGFLFNGAAAQDLSSDASLNDITLNNAAGLSVNSNLSLTGRLILDDGDVNMGANTLTLLSTASRTASIGQISSGSTFSGQVTLQRYIPSGIQNWVNLGNALPGNTLAAWDDDIFTTGFTGSQFPNYELNNVQFYDETVTGLLNDGWDGAADMTDALDHQRGYMVYMTATSQNIDVTGSIQQGEVTVNLNYNNSGVAANDGWELVSNIYPSEIDFEALHDASTNIGDTYYIYDAESGAYLTYTADLGIGSGNRYIASSQSFWVQTIATPSSLLWQESHKSDNGTSFERSNGDHQLITFSLSQGNTYQESHLVFEEDAQAAFEPGRDAVHLGSMNNAAPEMSMTASTGELLVVDRRPHNGAETSAGIYFEINEPGTVTFTVETVQNLDDLSCLFIEDLFTGDFYPVEEGESIELTFEETFNDIRLMLHHAYPIAAATTSPECEGDLNGSIELNVSVFPLNAVLTDVNDAILFDGLLTNQQIINGIGAGDFELTVTDEAGVCPLHTFELIVQEPTNPDVTVVTTPASCNEDATGVLSFDMSGNGDFSIELVDSDDNIINSFEGQAQDYEIGGLDPGFYTAWVTTVCNTGMQSYSLFDEETVEIEVAYNELVMLENGTALLQASAFTDNAESWYWTVNGNLVNTMGELQYAVAEPGVYTIMVTAYNAQCTETVSFEIIVEESAVSVNGRTQDSFEVFSSGIQLTIQTPQLDRNHLVNIYDISGRCVHSFNLPAGSERREVTLLEGLSTGVYIVELTNGQQGTRKKVVLGR